MSPPAYPELSQDHRFCRLDPLVANSPADRPVHAQLQHCRPPVAVGTDVLEHHIILSLVSGVSLVAIDALEVLFHAGIDAL